MISLRKGAPLIVLTAFIVTLLLHRLTANRESWSQAVGLGEYGVDETEQDVKVGPDTAQKPNSQPDGGSKLAGEQGTEPETAVPQPKPSASPVSAASGAHQEPSLVLVMPRITDEDVSWVTEELPNLKTAIYVADDPSAPLHPPVNKGHETMVYLTYIIEHYDTLPDISIFMHSHRWAWHNNELLNNDSAEMIRRLNLNRVLREGYFNMRCHWAPGCPDWMHPGSIDDDDEKQEQTVIAKAFSELFPSKPIPLVLSQPCCAQFAVSRDFIVSTPRETYEFYREWILRTDLSDYLSGRVWEYVWQVVFTGNGSYCPTQATCYCDGYGMCFGGEAQFDEYYEIRFMKARSERELREWQDKANKIDELMKAGKLDEASEIEVPAHGRDVQLAIEIDKLGRDLDLRRDQALERGKDPRMRALEGGRQWKEGDGF